jgi:signal transduction histidine kinase
METVTAFSESLDTLFTVVVSGILAFALARYISVFLTPKKNSRAFTACIVGIIFCLLDYISGVTWNNGYWSSVKGIVILAIMFVLTSILYRREYLKQLFLLLSFHTVMRISNILMTFLNNMISLGDRFTEYIFGIPDLPQELLHLYLKLSIAAYFLINTFVFAMFLFSCLHVIAKSFTFKTRRLETADTALMLLPCLTVFVITGLVKVFIDNALATDGDAMLLIRSFYDSYLGIILLSLIFLLFTLIFSVRMVQKSARLHIEETNAAILREQMKELQKHDDSGIYAEIRGMRHDMKNHLGNMRFLLESANGGSLESASELGSYVGKMNETLNRFEFAFQTGSPVIDAVIHGRYLSAKRKAIEFVSEFAFPPSTGIDAYDLAIILQNALDNACEACEAVVEGKRFIHMRSSVKAVTMFVEISNSYAGEIAFDAQTGLPLTAKHDTEEHGLGVTNIKRSAEKYGGDIDIRLSDRNGVKSYTLTIILPLSAD